MIREVRSVVYEEKEADRGLVESQRIVERGYLNRWITQGATDELKASLEAYEVMRPKVDNIEDIYKAKPVDFNTSILSSFNQT
jgi:hypothetical protein